MRKLLEQIAVATIVILTVPVSQGTPTTFELTYSGASFLNGAVATGSITFDGAILPNPGTLLNVSAAALGISAYSITVSGASSGNGTFGLANVNVNNWVWSATTLLNLNQNLVGQAGFNDFNWCAAL